MFISQVSPCLKALRGFRFATVNDIANKTYSKFQKAYAQTTQTFEDKMKEYEKTSAEEAPKRTTEKAFQHPYETDTHSIVFGGVKTFELWKDLVGAQQVSPHYENFLVSRKVALTYFAGLAVLLVGVNTHDLQWICHSLVYPFTFYIYMFYWWIEGKKSLIKPFLSNFYRKITWLEVNNMEAYFIENEEAKIRKLMKIARGQLDYQKLHNEYSSMRNNSIINFLINEQINLQTHINNRTTAVLRAAEGFEDINSKKIIEKLVNEARFSLDTVYEKNKEKIEQEMFQLALKGLQEGKMDYSRDPILPLIADNINSTINRFDGMSAEDQRKLISLTEDQIEQLRIIDRRMKDEFLNNMPKLEGPLKANPAVAKVLQNWSKTE